MLQWSRNEIDWCVWVWWYNNGFLCQITIKRLNVSWNIKEAILVAEIIATLSNFGWDTSLRTIGYFGETLLDPTLSHRIGSGSGRISSLPHCQLLKDGSKTHYIITFYRHIDIFAARILMTVTLIMNIIAIVSSNYRNAFLFQTRPLTLSGRVGISAILCVI